MSITAAAAAANNVIANGADVISPTFLYNIKERIQMAQVQLRLYSVVQALSQVKPDAKFENALSALNQSLFDYNQLLKLSVDLKQWEVCLHIYDSTHTQSDQNRIQTLYQNIINHEIRENMTRNWRPAVEAKILDLAQKFAKKHSLFPLSFLIEYLESVNLTNGEPQRDFVVNTFYKANISPVDLLNVYSKIIETQMSAESKIQKCMSIYTLISNIDPLSLPSFPHHIKTLIEELLQRVVSELASFSQDRTAAELLIRCRTLANEIRSNHAFQSANYF